jgi:outer membrane lipoprotein-sorting protein
MRALLLLLVMPLALVACGGGGTSSSSELKLSPTAYVKQAAQKSSAASSVHMKLKGSVTVPGGQSVVLSGDGGFVKHDGSFRLDFNAGGLGGSIDAVIQGTQLYVRSPLFADALPKGKTWLKLDLSKQASAQGLDLTKLAAQDPAQTLARLSSLGNVKEVGTEQVDGVDTTHYRGRLATQTAGATAGPFDVWVGKDDGYVRRMQFATGAAGSTPSTHLTMDLSDFGTDVTITVPSAAETADATTLNIPGLGG